uniref:Uncharacterized protein n=1 Tax=Siphoviridae sp. ctZHD14 TaxID=2827891 RepID=A0A8S5SVY0_9CAUD|nr:MAG TPA: hypothetical protein [Siphoviridae sp. ctZHD14]
MKPSNKDIQVEQNKANFVSWLLAEFGQKEFTNSEMKKHYNEAVTKAIENASENSLLKGLKKMFNDPTSNWRFGAPVRFYVIHKDERTVHVVFDTVCKSVGDIPFYDLVRYIDPLLTFPKSYTLNSEHLRDENFFILREEKITITKRKAVGKYYSRFALPCNNYEVESTLYSWKDESELASFFDRGYHIEKDEIETIRYYFKLNGAKAANYIMNQTKTAKKLREERTRCLIDEMTEADKIDVLKQLANYYGYFLE